MPSPHATLIAIALAGQLAAPGPAAAAVIDLFPGSSFETAAENLQPGDTLVVHAGTYEDSGRISVTVQGTLQAPVVIRGAAGEARPHITRPAGARAQNTINVEGARYLTIQGLEISSNGGDGINLNSNPAYITLEDLEIHAIDVGINFRSSMHHIVVRGNHIYDTAGTGEGMYVGCNYATCAVSESLIERNWIHDTTNASQGDGIEIKRGSYSNVVRDNVIHDTRYPCILVYGTEGEARNLVEGNAMWNCGDSGIQAAADAIIRNNLILGGNTGSAFNSQPHQGVTPKDLEFVHNTIVGGQECLRLSSWNDKPGLVFANNAIYCPRDDFAVSGLRGVTVSGNVVWPSGGGLPSGGYIAGRDPAIDLVDAAARNAYPVADSPLIGAGDPAHAVGGDYNGTARTGAPDAGAYAFTGATNPGGAVGAGFKALTGMPSVIIGATPDTVAPGAMSELAWITAAADSCTASGDWAGPKALSGTEEVGPLQADARFALACDGPGGSTLSEARVRVAAGDPGGGADDGAGTDSDSSAIGVMALCLLALARARHRRAPI